MADTRIHLANTTDPSITLETLNQAERDRLIPVVVYLVFLSFSGAVGNAIVFHVYRANYRASNSKYFVLSLCVVDLFSCLVSMPLEIATVLNQFTFDNVWLCKTSRFSNYVSAMSSSCIIGLIAVDRYRKVCKPFEWQIPMNFGKYLSMLCILIGILSSVPAVFIFGKKTHYVPLYGINGTECSTDDSMSGKALPMIHVTFASGLFGVDVVAIVVLYVLIGVTILRHEKSMPKHFRFRKDVSPGPQSFSQSGDFDNHHTPVKRRHSTGDQILDPNKNALGAEVMNVHSHRTLNDTLKNKHTDCVEDDCKVAVSLSMYDTPKSTSKSSSVSKCIDNFTQLSPDARPKLPNGVSENSNIYTIKYSGRSSDKLSPRHECNDSMTANTKSMAKQFSSRQASTRRTALLMFTVSMVFVACYTPHIILMFCRHVDENFVDELTPHERALYKFFLRSYFVNYAINPVIYCLCGSKFRNHFKQLICGKSRL